MSTTSCRSADDLILLYGMLGPEVTHIVNIPLHAAQVGPVVHKGQYDAHTIGIGLRHDQVQALQGLLVEHADLT